MPRFTLRQLEYLVACIDQGSIVGAAQVLNVSQPTVSTAISKLEDSLDVQLLIRQPAQGIIATANATRILQSARLLLEDAEALEHEAKQVSAHISGELRLGCFSTFAPLILPQLIQEFGHLYPDVRFCISEGTQEQLCDMLEANQIDMAFLYDVNLDDSLVKISLMHRLPYVVLPHDHPLAGCAEISLQQVIDDPFILLDVPPSQTFFLDLFKKAGLTPKIAYTSPSLELVRSLVGHGLGYSLLVTRPYTDLTYDGKALCVRPLKNPSIPSTIALVKPAGFRNTRLMAHFFDAVANTNFSDSTHPQQLTSE